MRDYDNEHYQSIVADLAYETVVADTLSPQPRVFSSQGFAEFSGILCRCDALTKELHDAALHLAI